MPNGQWEQAAIQQANNFVSAGMGLVLEGHNDRRQMKQQRKLQELQMEGNRQMADYNMSKQYDMWLKTNYAAQMEQMKKAGLNPGLMYGMGGGGGTTTGQSTGQVSGAEAPKGGGEVLAQQGMGIQQMAQMALLKAQKENIEADTENKRAETPNKPLQGENIKADTANKTIQGRILELDEAIKSVESEVAGQTQNIQISKASAELRKIQQEADILSNDKTISDATKQVKIEKAKADLAGVYAEIALRQAQSKLPEAQITNMAEQIKVAYGQLQNAQNQTEINQQMVNFETSWGKQAIDVLKTVINKIPLGQTITQMVEKTTHGPKGTTETGTKTTTRRN